MAASATEADDSQCLNGGYGWLEIECCRCKTRVTMPLDAIRMARDTPICVPHDRQRNDGW
jgi:hypothetical protein